MKSFFKTKSTPAFIVPTLIFIMLILTVSAISLSTFAVTHLNKIKTDFLGTSALLVAEAGAEQSLYQLNQDNSFTGYTSTQTFFSDNIRGKGTYTTEITSGPNGNEKFIIATGQVYRRVGDASPFVTRKVKLTVVGTTTQAYSVQTGPGGLFMSNSATIANGSVYIDGTLTMTNTARIGSAASPVNTNVAYESCPAGGGASYPKVCNSGQPISLTNKNFIFGAVRATGQTDGTNMSNSGLIPNSTVDPVSLPAYDRQAQVDAVNSTIAANIASCKNSETRTWSANLKIIGDVTIANGCTVTILGNVWITGSLSVNNSAKFKVDDSIHTLPTVMVDGLAGASLNQNTAILANSSSLGIQIIAFYSKAPCSPDCTNVTGSDLYNSRNVVTISIGNSGLAAGSFFYARWTRAEIGNSGSIGGVIGQTISLNNTGNISFGSNLNSGQSIWSIKNYQQVF